MCEGEVSDAVGCTHKSVRDLWLANFKNGNAMHRIFVAVPLAAEVKAALSAIPRVGGHAVRWGKESQYHITLKFLGEMDGERVKAVERATRGVVEPWSEPITLSAKGLGAFPHLDRARILWAGIDGEVGRLKRLQAELDGALAASGFPVEKRPFRPHITLARMRTEGPLPPPLHAYLQHDFGSWRVECVQVIESELLPTGPKYTVLHQLPIVT